MQVESPVRQRDSDSTPRVVQVPAEPAREVTSVKLPVTRFLFALVTTAVALTGCGDDSPEVRNGVWGGLGIQVDVASGSSSVKFCCNSTGTVAEPLVPNEVGEFFARGLVFTHPGDYRGTVSGNSMRLVVTAYPPTDPQGFVINAPGGNPYFTLTYGTPFVEKEGTVGCVCSPCVGCPP